MPFPSRNLPADLIGRINAFVDAEDFQDLYRSYDWKNDTHEKKFPDILTMERRLRAADMGIGISLDDVKAVAEWGGLSNHICGPDIVLPAHTLLTSRGDPVVSVGDNPTSPVEKIVELVDGVGPTYATKVIRFALAEEYGVMDSWCVRVFGNGDPENKKHDWLSISADSGGRGWSISQYHRFWPTDYGVWINIRRHIEHRLNRQGIECPHPPNFVQAGRRANGRWTCADVEMALFAFTPGGQG